MQRTDTKKELSAEKTPKKSVDRRVRKTKDSLRHCLAELLKKKKIQEITVKELTEMSDINRGTFYLHYRDVFDLLEQIEAELMEEFNSTLNRFDSEVIKAHPARIFDEVFSLIKKRQFAVFIEPSLKAFPDFFLIVPCNRANVNLFSFAHMRIFHSFPCISTA